MYESTDPDPDLAKTRKSAAEARTRRVLLFVAPQDSVSEPLVDALEREFPWIIVEQVEDLQAAMVRFRAPVLLILIDSVFLYEIDACAFELSRFHPAAAKAVIHDDLRSPLKASDVLASRNLRGVLPMNLKLDVWLSVVRLMLRGGEYFPATMFRPFISETVTSSVPRRGGRDGVDAARLGQSDVLEELTEREREILQMVARGLQNKVIAAALGLSQHTVKIHLHNIIRKLGVHNRTEAAALFLGLRQAFSGLPGKVRT